MRVFVAGASGFIGRHVARALVASGATVVGGARDPARATRLLPGIDWIAVEFNRDIDPAVWRTRLAGFDALVNCVGILQSDSRDRSRRIHVDATVALFRGALEAGVKRSIHISAIGADATGSTEFARDKAAADAALLALGGDTVILRPSLAYARDTYGGTALIRSLSGLPGIVPIPRGETSSDPIHADDLAAIVVRCLGEQVPGRRIFEVGGPQRLTLREFIDAQREWLGFNRARYIDVPDGILRLALWFGDIAGWLGNPGPMRSTTFAQARAMPPADSVAITAATGVQPRAVRDALASQPASSADRLEARLGFAMPALRIALGLFWIVSGLIALLPAPFRVARATTEVAGISPELSGPAVVLAALVDVALGVPMLVGVAVRKVALVQAAVGAAYVVLLSILVPTLWLDPLGPLVKVVPAIFAALLIAATVERGR